MPLDKEQVQDLLDEFVISNDSDIERVSKENHALYDAVIAGLSLLSARFGQGHVPKPIFELKPEEIEEEEPQVEIQPKKTKKTTKKSKKEAEVLETQPPQEEEFSEEELLESIASLELLADFDDEAKEELEIARKKLKSLKNRKK
jgi:hypothetical protein